MRPLASSLAFLLATDASGLAAQAKQQSRPDHPPALSAFGTYTRRMSAVYGTTAPLEPCRLTPLSLGQADSTRLRWFHHWLTLPSGFAHGPTRLRYDSLWHPQLQRKWLVQEWMQDLYVEPVDWYRWTRAVSGNAQGSTWTLIQLREYRNYPVILARSPWSITDVEECEWQTLGEGARVMRFTLVHPELPSQWVLTAAWYGRREPTARGFLSIGPDEASQAEALEILRLLRPDGAKAPASSPAGPPPHL
jgi:hypothetical protein